MEINVKTVNVIFTRGLICILCLLFLSGLVTAALADTHHIPSISAEFRAMLNADEIAFLNKNPIIRVNGPDTYPPFSFFDKTGLPQGLAYDYLELIMSKAGLKVEFQPQKPWAEVLKDAREKNLDLIPLLAYDPNREAFLHYTDHYLSFPPVIR